MNNVQTPKPTEETLSYWSARGLGSNNLPQIKAADILVVPLENFREGAPFAFHQGTIDLFNFLKQQAAGHARVAICADDDEYFELTIHSASFRISTIIVKDVVAPVLLGLLSNYIYDKLNAKPTDQVEAKIIVEDHQCRAFQFEYKGDAKDFGVLTKAVGEFAKKCMAQKSTPVSPPKK